MTLRNLMRLGLGAAALAACSFGANSRSSIGPTLPSGIEHSQVRYAVQKLVIPSDSCCIIAIDSGINQIYVSSGVNLSGNKTTVVDGETFSVVARVTGFGGASNVDSATHNVWLAGLHGGDVEVYSGKTDSPITKVSLGFCPVGSWVDAKHRYAWISAQCGEGKDPVWAIGADTYKIVAGPIRTSGVMNQTVVNSVTGRFYVDKNGDTNYEIDPNKGFAVSRTSFGVAYNVDTDRNRIYAVIASGLNIVAGSTDEIKKTVTLSYTPGEVGVNPALDHIYLADGNDFVEVREGDTGNLLGTITLKGFEVYGVGGDHSGGTGNIYVAGAIGSKRYLYKIADTY